MLITLMQLRSSRHKIAIDLTQNIFFHRQSNEILELSVDIMYSDFH